MKDVGALDINARARTAEVADGREETEARRRRLEEGGRQRLLL